MSKIVSGIQATNRITLGNYLGAIKSLVSLQNNNQLIIFIADLHSLTNSFDPIELRKMRLDVAKIYFACGIKNQDSIVFYQSDISEHSELSWILTCHTNLGQLSRMTQFKDKSLKKEVNGTSRVPTGLLVYPVLMASDILLYSPGLVPVGSDQKQHLELARDIAINFNSKYSCDTFKIPEIFTPKIGSRIMDLQDPTKKMSKSSQNSKGVIFLLEDLEITKKKIMISKTDLLNNVKFDVKNQPGVSNLLNIYSSLKNIEINEAEEIFKGVSYKNFKESVADVICKELNHIQTSYNSLFDKDVITSLSKGAIEAKKIASKKLKEIKKIIGLIND